MRMCCDPATLIGLRRDCFEKFRLPNKYGTRSTKSIVKLNTILLMLSILMLPLQSSYSKIVRGGMGGGGFLSTNKLLTFDLKFQYRLFIEARGVSLIGVYTDTNLRARAT